ncbi:MAG: hypothetical protein GF307_15175 [candidate division Zixibacteria bacterium]|nr:hypothetical protein [candidate division Zixibacteria bacterium]
MVKKTHKGFNISGSPDEPNPAIEDLSPELNEFLEFVTDMLAEELYEEHLGKEKIANDEK